MHPQNGSKPTIVEFLTARLDEVEATARSATAGPWRWAHEIGNLCNDPECPYGELWGRQGDMDAHVWDVHGFDVHDGNAGDAAHIAAQDPARTFRRAEAQRRILTEHGDQHECTDSSGADFPYVGCRTVRLMALEWADHPDYQPEWSLT